MRSQAVTANATQPPDLRPSSAQGHDTDGPLLSDRTQSFKFTPVDFELLRQVNAFDRYIGEKGWVYDDPGTNRYLETIGLALAPSKALENVAWRFRAIRDLEVNAFALPNGSIYVNSGLLSRMENETQLAGVLAHEVAHVVNRHSYLAYRSSRKKAVATDLVLAAAGAASYAGVSPVITSTMATMLPMIVSATIFGYSRTLEHEADIYAVDVLAVKNYDLREFSRGLELLRKGPEVDLAGEPLFWSSHPKLASRVQYVGEMAAKLQSDGANFQVGQVGYRSATSNVARHNAEMAIMLGRPRTALAVAQRLVADRPNDAENYVLLGDAYCSLGARTPVPAPREFTNAAKYATRERMRNMTIVEYDRALLQDPDGAENWKANAAHAEQAFQKALGIDPQNASVHRGLGHLFERKNARADAIAEFKKYIELAPGAKDARQIKVHVELLERPSLEGHD